MINRFGFITLCTLMIGVGAIFPFEQKCNAMCPSPKGYSDSILKARYLAFIDTLDTLVLTFGYKAAVANLTSSDPEKQIIGIRVLKESRQLEMIPLVVPMLNSNQSGVRVEAAFALKNMVEHYALQRRDYSQGDKMIIKPLADGDPDLRALAWVVLQLLRLSDDYPNEKSYAATMAGYLNLYFFQEELQTLLQSRHPAVVNSATYGLLLLETAHGPTE